MNLANVDWIGTICTALALACSIQLLITGLLAVTIPELLLLTGSHVSTAAGLVAGFVALPTALRIKTSQISPNMSRVYGYTACYQRLALCVSALLHLIATILAVVALVITSDLTEELMRLIKNYQVKQSSKIMVDNIQYVLQCCGAANYDDWFKVDWGGYELAAGVHKSKRALHQLLKDDTDAYPDLSLIRFDAVPYSCCAKAAIAACIHHHIVQLGTHSINTCGCGNKLSYSSHALLWFELILYLSCFILECVVFLLLGDEDQAGFLGICRSGFLKKKRAGQEPRKRKRYRRKPRKVHGACACGDSGKSSMETLTITPSEARRSSSQSSVRSRSSVRSAHSKNKARTPRYH